MKKIHLGTKEVKTIQVNSKDKVVTVVSKDLEAQSYNALCKFQNTFRYEEGKKPLEYEERIEKVVTFSKPDNRDEFDPYIGVALALAYNLFGSKTQFRKYVKEEILKEKEEVKDTVKEVQTPSIPKEDLYRKYTLEQLRTTAKARGLKGYSRLTKAELIDLLFYL